MGKRGPTRRASPREAAPPLEAGADVGRATGLPRAAERRELGARSRRFTRLPSWVRRNLLLVAAYAVSVTILLAVLLSVAPYEGATFPDSKVEAVSVTDAGSRVSLVGTAAAQPSVRLRLEVVGVDVGEHAVRLQVGALVSPERLTPEQLAVYLGAELYSDGKPGLPVSVLGYGETFVYRIQQLSAENDNESVKTTYLAYPSGSTSRYPFDRYSRPWAWCRRRAYPSC